jgi:CubicO group peptidase (beta-lactamase class C family)
MVRGRIVCMTLSSVLAAACSTTGAGSPGSESRIAHVLGGLHARTSDTSAPTARWTLEERMAHYRVPAVGIAVIHDGRLQWARAYEVTAEGERRAISDQSLFQAASISKAVTAFAALRVVDRGQIALDAPVNRYLRSWRLPESETGSSDSVTVARVLAHMAGLNVPGFPGYQPGVAIPTLIQILDGTAPANTPPIRIVQPPGSGWAYSGGGYVVLQQLLQDVTGLDFPTLMDRLVLAPLGMDHSTFRQPLPANLEAQAAVGHDEDGEALPGRWHVYPELAAAGLWTTASDLARFALAVRAAATQSPRGLLSQESAVALTTPRFGSFSLGLLVRRNREHAWFTYNGGNAGYRALLYAYLTVGEGAVVMANSDAGMALAREIINSVALEYGWPGFVPEELQ